MAGVALATVFIAGLLGSTHCVVMCGGLATALATAPGPGARSWRPLLYQLGRLMSYCAAGALAGALGFAAGSAFVLPRLEASLRVATAVFVVVIGLNIALRGVVGWRWLRFPELLGARAWRRVAPAIQRSLPREPALRALSLGALWGFMPCGLVYSVLLVAAAAGSAARGGVLLLAFGLGTLPAMLGLAQLGGHLVRADGSLVRLVGAVIVACGLWTAAVPLAELNGASPHHHRGLETMPSRSGPVSTTTDAKTSTAALVSRRK